MRRCRLILLALSLLFLTLGACIYLFLRSGTYLNRLIPLATLQTKNNLAFISFLKYWFADFLWCGALAFALCATRSRLTRHTIVFSCASAGMLGSLVEVTQLVKLCSGTADLLDVVMYFTAAALAAVISIKIIEMR